MKNRHFVIFIFLLLCRAFLHAQAPKGGKPISADCSRPIAINISSNTLYGKTIAPNGPGNKNDFKPGSSLIFDGEHNTAWYLLNITKTGEMAFDIQPTDTTNDYDFLLYAYTDSTFCESVYKNKLKPIRSNLSNIKKSVKGVTGLRQNTSGIVIGEGIGESFSKPLPVKKGEKYMLVLDNVTPGGDGHLLQFYFLKEVKIKGKVINSDSMALQADITVSDNRGKTVKEVKSDANGEYSIITTVKEDQNYSITYISDNEFVEIGNINTKNLKGGSEFSDIKTVLPKLKAGEKYKLGNINFYGNESVLLPESYPSVEALYKLMKKNRNMVIQIQGHVNDPKGEYGDLMDQGLSDDRANTVYDYLLKKGIEKERISRIGLSNKYPLFKNPLNEVQMSANRRVEIKVVSIR